MTNIVKFPQKEKRQKPLPRQRVFYIGFRYVGPMLCQEVQNIYLKRNGLKNNVRTWSLITYGKYEEEDYKEYSIELESCKENDLPSLLDEFNIGNQITFKELRAMGWRGQIDYSASIISLYSSSVISLIHKCYNNVIFPHFVKPLFKGQFNGTKIMMESRDAVHKLEKQDCYAFTHYRNEYPLGHVWMNLPKVNSKEYAAVPVAPVKKFSDQFYSKNFISKDKINKHF